ncbi:PREDICTED: E3 ubiquitin-protein ligase RNF14-like [Ceratosolen solmsi marchali]|uniref:RBR-type E3 ubiquitin transferase n=1 Tax=Ceratosolen solmsi marchali TaxID=326594 RepID=A0AAJ6YMZ3_9HYME|nr:PREDICTED: E3 ubiquitin-protein ligase RNF14-like [Ceratosolen solmsi marchali]XP_011501034.1 PREDICTED: E3 ubiquitin-protein ligase RNF14-like [Ceratosolen solmsi marchali]
MDSEKQKDELTALESIYNEEEFSYCIKVDQYEIIIKIFINLHEKYFFTYTDNQLNNEPRKKINISYLPPLTLLILLPVNYPSTSPPNFTLRCSWLNVFSISKLCKELDELWKNNTGQEILFTWISFLQSETLKFLKIQECINIDNIYKLYEMTLTKTKLPQGLVDFQNSITDDKKFKESKFKDGSIYVREKIKIKNKVHDQRAVHDIFIGINPVQMLIDYNEMQKQIEFKKNLYSCKICFTDKSGEYCTQFLPCTHVFCKECITGYFEVRIKEGTVQNILCPKENCKSEVSPGQIKDLVSTELFSKYDSILLNITLDTMTDIIYCPRKSCQYPVSQEPNEIMANCPICQYVFCIFCKAVYHGIAPCKITIEKQNLAKEYQEASNEKKSELEQRYGKKQLQMLVENSMTENWIHTNSQKCPHCNTAIEKSDGCNKMTCWKCNTFFCWICNVQLNRGDPYIHYRDPHSKCFNMLYHGLIINENDEEEFENDEYYFDDEDNGNGDEDMIFVLDY